MSINKITRKLCPGFVMLIMVMSVFSGAVSVSATDTNSKDLPSFSDSYLDEIVFVEEPNATRHFTTKAINDQIQPSAAKSNLQQLERETMDLVSFNVSGSHDLGAKSNGGCIDYFYAVPTRIPADGKSTSTIYFKVWCPGKYRFSAVPSIGTIELEFPLIVPGRPSYATYTAPTREELGEHRKVTITLSTKPPVDPESESVTITLEPVEMDITLKTSKEGYSEEEKNVDNSENFGRIDISGMVTDKATGDPIDGATVEITSGANPDSTTTGADGTYTIEAVVPEGSGSDTRGNVDFQLEVELAKVEIEQIPKHVVKDVEAEFVAHAYDSKDREIPPSNLAYEWSIDSEGGAVDGTSQTLEYAFDTEGKHRVYCAVTYGEPPVVPSIQTLERVSDTEAKHTGYSNVASGAQQKTAWWEFLVEPLTITFKQQPFQFSPMAGEEVDVEFKVNTPSEVKFEYVTIRGKYYPTWSDWTIAIPKKKKASQADVWYKVENLWNGRLEDGRPAMNGEYTVSLEVDPDKSWYSRDRTCRVKVYDDATRFVSIERDYIKPFKHPARKSGEVKGYAKWMGGEYGGWVIEFVTTTGGAVIGGPLGKGLRPLAGAIVGWIVGKFVAGGIDKLLPVEYIAYYKYTLEKVHWYPYVTDKGKRYGPIPNWIVVLMREDVIRTVMVQHELASTEKSDRVWWPTCMRGLFHYIDQSTIKYKKEPYYKASRRDISKAQLYGKDTDKGKKYCEFVLNSYKRLKLPLAKSVQQAETITAAGLGYNSEPIYDFSSLSAPWESQTSAQSQPAEFSGYFSDYRTDSDADGLYNTLTILAGVDVSVAGSYIVQGGLFDASGAPIIWSGNYSQLESGTHDIVLDFNGIMIYRHGVAEQYNLKYIRLYDENMTQIDELTDAYVTSAYDYADFQTPPASFSGTYSDQGTDIDGDGLFDYLTVSVGVEVSAAGDYTMIGNLIDSSGEPITWVTLTSSLATGSHTVDLDFDGVDLRQHDVAGPYNLSVLLMSGGILIDNVADAYTTSSYSQDDFQHAAAQFNGVFSDQGRDTDGDGRYNYLTLSAGVDVFQAGSYIATGYLYDENEGLITWASDTSFWNTGSQTVYLDFDGVAIRQNAVSGPYDISVVLAKEENPEADLSYSSHTTSAYNYADFQATAEDFCGDFSDYGRDTDDDGFFDYLALSAELTISNAGDYGIVGNLYDKNGELITWASDYAELDVGSQPLVLYFDGLVISRHAVDGPYTVSLALLRDGNLEEVLSSSSYTTSAYSYTDFQAAQPPIASFTYLPLNPAVNEIITFTASNSYDSDGFIVNYEWDFGDGFNKTGEVVTHAYASPGNYSVILTVTDDDGAVDTETKDITVSGEKTIYVDDDFTDDPANHKWDTIQEGIKDAYDGDTVLVYNGTYTETVALNKRLTLIGDGMPEIDAQSLGDAINITADNCTVKGFICVNAQPSPYAGIRVDSSNNVIVENTCRDNYEGIYLLGSSNEIRNNIAKNNQHSGIRLQASDDNIIKDNTAKGNGANGIRLKASDYNRIMDNDASNSVNYHGISVSASNNNEVRNNVANSNHYQGIGLWSSTDNIISNNTVKENGNNGIYLQESNDNGIAYNNVSNNVNYHGISLHSSNNNDIHDNTANTNGVDGIYLDLSNDNKITGNDASNNVNYHGISLKLSNKNEIRNNIADSNHYDGIKLRNSTDNIISNNTVKNNEDDGISLTNSNNNRIYMNNFMDNDNNVYSEDSTNIWHSTSERTYRFNGNTHTNYLGNYWDDYTGSDTDNDGIGDISYNINSDNDNYPLKEPVENYFLPIRLDSWK